MQYEIVPFLAHIRYTQSVVDIFAVNGFRLKFTFVA